jgi:phosphoglycolate phosphatase
MPIKLIIFDLDGTLVNTSADITAALNHAVAPYGIPPISVAETITLVGEGARALIDKVLRAKAPHIDPSTVLKAFIAYYADHMADRAVPYPGAAEVLAALSQVKKAVVSNKMEALSVGVLDALGLLHYFDYVSGGDTSAEKKPSAVPILDVLSRFALQPAEALLVGDSIYDMLAARASGVRSVAALYGFGSPGFSEGADFTIGRLGELVDIVKRLNG